MRAKTVLKNFYINVHEFRFRPHPSSLIPHPSLYGSRLLQRLVNPLIWGARVTLSVQIAIDDNPSFIDDVGGRIWKAGFEFGRVIDPVAVDHLVIMIFEEWIVGRPRIFAH